MELDIPHPHPPPHSDPHKEPGGLWHEPNKVARQAETTVARFPSEQTDTSLGQLLPAMSFLVHKYCIFNRHKMEPLLPGSFCKKVKFVCSKYSPPLLMHHLDAFHELSAPPENTGRRAKWSCYICLVPREQVFRQFLDDMLTS